MADKKRKRKWVRTGKKSKQVLQIAINSVCKYFIWFAQSHQNNYEVFPLFEFSKQPFQMQLSKKQPSEKQLKLSRVSKTSFSTCSKSAKRTTKFFNLFKVRKITTKFFNLFGVIKMTTNFATHSKSVSSHLWFKTKLVWVKTLQIFSARF